ncbi:MAG: ATP-binding protein [Gemmatimonadaceae bacterium]|nr:ATP-binding protein [Gemmatimonadaceae bacterium]
MTTVITVPQSLDDHTVESVFEQVAQAPADGRLLIDARHATWSSPFGLASLLCLGQVVGDRASFAVPEASDTVSYWARAGFFKHAGELFELVGSVPRSRENRPSDVLLELTPIVRADDVHAVVGRIQDRAQEILQGQLHLEGKATVGFAMTLSEICQNIVEHAGRGGWVAVQSYSYRRRLAGRRVVQLAVCDAGMGFRGSLDASPIARRDDRWDDAAALGAAMLRAVSRFGDPGRGHGLAGVRRWVGRWEGKMSIRSGTARMLIQPNPSWEPEPPLVERLAPFPGAQVQITIPERVGIDTPRSERAVASRR